METGLGDLPRQISQGLAKISLAIRSKSWREAPGHGLSPTQGQILVTLRHEPDGLSLRQVAGALAITAPTASDAVRALVAKGLVEKDVSDADRRELRLRLTPAGRELAGRVAEWPDFLATAAAALAPAEQVVFLRGLVKMIRNLQLRGEIPVARMCVTCRYFRPNVHPDPDMPHHCDFVDAPFGDRQLRLECPDHQGMPPAREAEVWGRLGWES